MERLILESLESRTLFSTVLPSLSAGGTYDYSGSFSWRQGQFITGGTQSGTVKVTSTKINGRSDATDGCVSLYRLTLNEAPSTTSGKITIKGKLVDKCGHGSTTYVVQSGYVRFRKTANGIVMIGRLTSFGVSGPDAGGTLISNFKGPRK